MRLGQHRVAQDGSDLLLDVRVLVVTLGLRLVCEQLQVDHLGEQLAPSLGRLVAEAVELVHMLDGCNEVAKRDGVAADFREDLARLLRRDGCREALAGIGVGRRLKRLVIATGHTRHTRRDEHERGQGPDAARTCEHARPILRSTCLRQLAQHGHLRLAGSGPANEVPAHCAPRSARLSGPKCREGEGCRMTSRGLVRLLRIGASRITASC